MEALWCAIVIFLPVGLCHQTESDAGLRYAYTATIYGDTVSCFGTGYVDGEAFATYSLGKIHNTVKWFTEANAESEKNGFKNRCDELELELRKLTNKSKTAGIRTLQVSTECKTEMDMSAAYNGELIQSLSLNNTHSQGCSYRLKIYRNLMSKDVKSPHVNVERRLLHHSESAKLRCSARDFYPAGLDMRWCLEKNDTSTDSTVEKNLGPLPQGDGLYRRHIEIVVRVGEESRYVCKIHGIATNNDMKVLRWEGASSGLSDGAAFLLALFLPATAAIVIIAFGFVWHRRGELRPFQLPGRSSDGSLAPTIGRRVLPFANSAV